MTTLERLGDAFTFDPDGCWRWSRALQANGYTLIRDGGHQRLAHRGVYELVSGPIPDGLALDHRCRVRHCVNPAHLEPVTTRENTRRGTSPVAVNAAKSRCIRGHVFDPANTYTHGGKRYCRACKATEQRERRARVQ